MPLPDDYLKYPWRRHGMDHDLYPWSDLFERKPIEWPGARRSRSGSACMSSGTR